MSDETQVYDPGWQGDRSARDRREDIKQSLLEIEPCRVLRFPFFLFGKLGKRSNIKDIPYPKTIS